MNTPAATPPEDAPGCESRDAFGLLVDLAVYAPVGALVTARRQVPRQLKQRRQALENRVQLARFIGQLAVETGRKELARRLEEQRAQRSDATHRVHTDTDTVADAHTDTDTDTVADADTLADTDAVAEADTMAVAETVPDTVAEAVPTDGPASGVPAAADLPISDYESLPAINVVERLRSMRPDEVEAVRRFEAAHRARRTVLAKIEQLQGG